VNLKEAINLNEYHAQTGMVEGLGQILYRDYVLPFELVSILFFVAMVGAVMLGKREAGERNF
jgi:NADH-quinone oxidoreductase subunit J